MKRRKFIKKAIFGTLAAGFLCGIYSWQIEPYWLEFVQKKMPIKNLPENLIGKTLLQISDMHIGNRFNHQYIIDSFKKAQELNPDYVVYTGDFVSYDDKKQFTQLKEVFKHAVTGKLGTAGVLGNHDYGHDWIEQEVANSITSILENAGVKILSNEEFNFNGLIIIGLDDFWGLNFDPKKIMDKHNSKNANLVLCHNPDVCDLDIWNNYKGWILAGHTHGGQVKPPFLNPLILPVKKKKIAQEKLI